MKLYPALLILFIALCVCYLIVFFHYKNEKKLNRKEISDSVASVMASKIASDAKRHRKNRENYNYIKSKVEKKEQNSQPRPLAGFFVCRMIGRFNNEKTVPTIHGTKYQIRERKGGEKRVEFQ